MPIERNTFGSNASRTFMDIALPEAILYTSTNQDQVWPPTLIS